MISIIDRKKELELLENIWKNKKNSFLVLYGRRRIGKTTLLKEFIKNKEGLFYIAEDTIKTNQITEFKIALGNYLNDEFMQTQNFDSWSGLFTYLSKTINKNKKFFIWIDEFSYLIKNDKSITSTLQKFIDHTLRESNIHLLTSGSLFGIMKEEVLSHSSPLYGRRTNEILLEEIPTKYNFEFLENMNFINSLQTIMVCGGVPQYLQIANSYNNFNDFIEKEFFTKTGYFFRELTFLLSAEFKEIRTYFAILNAISYGNVKPGEIANFIGMNARSIYPYLELLIIYGFIKKEVTFDRPKEGIYTIKDSFIDFWFNFTYKNRTSIERETYKLSKQDLSIFFGKRFEELIRDNLHYFFNDNFNNIARWWYKEIEIDICAINENSKLILFGECKYKDNVDAKQILEELKEKTKHVKWNNETRLQKYVIFAKSFKDKNIAGVKLYDLKDMEEILKVEKNQN